MAKSSSRSMEDKELSKGTKRRAAETHVLVTDDELEEKGKIELPLEEDETLRLSTLSHAFGGAYGLKYRNPDTGAFRGLKVDELDRVHPPSEGWGNTVYIIIFQKSENTKRKMEDGNDGSSGATKQKRLDQKKCSDLVVLGIPYKTNEDELREYFEQFGEVVVSQVKRDHKTQKSKGFGFVRFADYDSQLKALAATKHSIEGRSVEVKIPNSKEQSGGGPQSKKIFVGRVPESMAAEELRQYFEQKGEVTDVYIPRPFRAFAFVTFSDPNVAQALCGEDHVINGNSVHVSQAVPKQDGAANQIYGGGARNYAEGKGGKSERGRPISPGMSPPQKGMMTQQHSRYVHQQDVWSGHSPRANDHQIVHQSYSSGGGNPWSFNPGPPIRGATPTGRSTPMAYQQPIQDMYGGPPGGAMPPQMAAPMPSNPPPYMPSSAVSAGTNQATVGLSNLNLNSLITPQAIQAALTSALAGLLPSAAAGQQGPPGSQPGPPTTGLDLTALLSSLQTGGGMPQFGGMSVTTSNAVPWPVNPVSSHMAQGQPDMVVSSAGGRNGGRAWQDDDVNGGGGWHHDM